MRRQSQWHVLAGCLVALIGSSMLALESCWLLYENQCNATGSDAFVHLLHEKPDMDQPYQEYEYRCLLKNKHHIEYLRSFWTVSSAITNKSEWAQILCPFSRFVRWCSFGCNRKQGDRRLTGIIRWSGCSSIGCNQPRMWQFDNFIYEISCCCKQNPRLSFYTVS